MNATETINLTIQCDQCGGEGSLEIGPICNSPASQCCGGCFDYVECKECHSGDVELEISIDDLTEMIESIRDNDIKSAQKIINEIIENK